MRKLYTLLIAASAAIVLTCSAHAVDLEVRKGKIVELPRPASHVFIANPDIADIEVRSPSFIYVYGTAVGETTLHAMDAENNIIFMDDVVVSLIFQTSIERLNA